MTEKELLLRHSHVVLKEILKELNTAINKFDKFSNTSYDAEVGTSQYWSTVASMEQMQKEIDGLIKKLHALDAITSWSSKLHQDRYKFVNKYKEALKRYEVEDK
ncbi:DUF1140 family protein [Staphylococcus ratti]|uniref:DUF1140 family protein n=1 Tax=Staphylococcus ratti TaxID=2892440 RepID=A0ABY3PBR3_9STAP|nr:DUF1140 family protein [Staphylococcus ratti]UEX89704.1 DUF1140 family protein [Staphylococcus ratti]